MSTMSHRRNLTALTVGAVLALPAASVGQPPSDALPFPGDAAATSYDQNAASGEFHRARTGSAGGVAPIHSQIGPAVPRTTAASQDTGFSWGDAGTGAGIAVLLTAGVAVGARTTARRRHPVARVGS